MTDPGTRSSISDLDRTRALQQAFAESRQRVYLERPETLDQLARFLPPSVEAPSPSTGSPSTLVVTGPSGSGKSALLAHWSQRAAGYNPRAAVIAFFVGAVGARLSHLEMIRHLLEELRDRFSIDEEIPTDPAQLERAFGTWLMRLKDQPLLLMIDALDQLDEESQSLRWLPSTLPQGVRMILSARESRALEELTRRRMLATLEITPLSYSERLQLSAQYLGARREAIGQEALERVARQSGSSNPLFHRIRVQELQRATNAVEAGEIVERYALASTLEELYAKVFERIEVSHGGALVSEVLMLLATSRRGMERSDLEALTQCSSPTLDEVLSALSNHLIVQGEHVSLYHEAMRRAVVEKYLADPVELSEIHMRIGKRLQGEIPDRLDRAFDDRTAYDSPNARIWREAAYHFREAGEWELLRDHLCSIPVFLSQYRMPVGSDLISCWRSLVEQGIDPSESYNRTLEEYDRVVPGWDELLHASNLLGRMLVMLGRQEDALPVFRRMAEVAEERGELAHGVEAHSYVAWVLHRKGINDEARERLERALALARELDEPESITNVLLRFGTFHFNRGEYAASLERYREHLEISRRAGNREWVAQAIGNMGSTYYNQGEYDRALECYRQRLEMAEEMEDRDGIARAIGNIGIAHYAKGEYQRSLECQQKKLEIARELEDRDAVSVATGNMGITYLALGEYEQALECHREQRRIAESMGDRSLMAIATGNMGLVHVEQHDHAQALECFRTALAEHRATGYVYGITSWLVGTARTLVDLASRHQEPPEYLSIDIPDLVASDDSNESWKTIVLREARRHAEECIELSIRSENAETLSAARTLLQQIEEENPSKS